MPALTALRGCAALYVFSYHAQVNGVSVFLRPVFAIGYSGVAFFFILSGFILSWSARAGDTPCSFFRRRFARVWPAHAVTWALALAYLLTYAPRPELGGRPTLVASALSFLLLQAWVPVHDVAFGVNGVAWSLSCEAFFYLIFPPALLLVRGQSARTAMAAGVLIFLGCASLQIYGSTRGAHVDEVLYAFPLTRVGEFLLGVGLGVGVRSGFVRRVPRTAVMCAMLLAAGAPLAWHVRPDHSHGLVDPMTAPLYAVVIVAAVIRPSPSWLVDRRLVYLGELSFAFYLTHLLVIHAVQVAEPGWSAGTVGSIGVSLLELGLALAASVAIHHVVELPARRWLLGRSSRKIAA